MSTRGTYRISTPPASEPVTLAEARAHLNFTDDDSTDDDAYIESLIGSARAYCEEHCNRAFLSQEITQVLPCFPAVDGFRNEYGSIRLYRPPFIEVTEISYIDADGTAQTLTPNTNVNYSADLGLIWPLYGETWPQTQPRPDAVTVTYTAGWANAAAVPKAIKQAILLTVGKHYDNREDSVKALPTTVENLLAPWVVKEY